MNDLALAADLSSDGQHVHYDAPASRALAPIIDNRGRGLLRDRVEGAWMRLGGPACVQEPTDLEDVKVYLDSGGIDGARRRSGGPRGIGASSCGCMPYPTCRRPDGCR